MHSEGRTKKDTTITKSVKLPYRRILILILITKKNRTISYKIYKLKITKY